MSVCLDRRVDVSSVFANWSGWLSRKTMTIERRRRKRFITLGGRGSQNMTTGKCDCSRRSSGISGRLEDLVDEQISHGMAASLKTPWTAKMLNVVRRDSIRSLYIVSVCDRRIRSRAGGDLVSTHNEV